ncbi:hypothetical protein AE621_11690 [Acidovorax sp. SD340]|nr:hypothetical protein AE621_11690 [Acidovorax sp. SD340]
MLSIQPHAGQEKFGPKKAELGISFRPGSGSDVPSPRSPVRAQHALLMHTPPQAVPLLRSIPV